MRANAVANTQRCLGEKPREHQRDDIMNGHDVLARLEKQRNPRLVEAMKYLNVFQQHPGRQQHR
jgi:hypothetical protein